MLCHAPSNHARGRVFRQRAGSLPVRHRGRRIPATDLIDGPCGICKKVPPEIILTFADGFDGIAGQTKTYQSSSSAVLTGPFAPSAGVQLDESVTLVDPEWGNLVTDTILTAAGCYWRWMERRGVAVHWHDLYETSSPASALSLRTWNHGSQDVFVFDVPVTDSWAPPFAASTDPRDSSPGSIVATGVDWYNQTRAMDKIWTAQLVAVTPGATLPGGLGTATSRTRRFDLELIVQAAIYGWQTCTNVDPGTWSSSGTAYGGPRSITADPRFPNAETDAVFKYGGSSSAWSRWGQATVLQDRMTFFGFFECGERESLLIPGTLPRSNSSTWSDISTNAGGGYYDYAVNLIRDWPAEILLSW